MWHVCVTSSARNIFSSGAAIPQGDCTEESACELLILITPWMQPSNWLKVTGIDRRHNLGQKVSTMQHNLFSDLKIIRPVLRRLPLSAGCKVWIDTSHFDTNSSSETAQNFVHLKFGLRVNKKNNWESKGQGKNTLWFQIKMFKLTSCNLHLFANGNSTSLTSQNDVSNNIEWQISLKQQLNMWSRWKILL